ncbi:GntR family transcriptional regulator [Devosia sp. YIM 151766]|uniref:GntR family transcriptional regulator n=1 Tax=Devosia sp. YIM 151766 TaxID=3017325 RepID=UPI00255CED76|nr:GntR family transcriptional regulator [Devosia sp. YIM 151766]WIY53221.1 GntR family transcriptional regulator [Devosia sp. YIM 151766]
MRSAPAIIQREALGSQVAAALREAIAAGEYVHGERLIEVELAERFGVSRGPIRDAFGILQAEGLVEKQQPGVIVIGIDHDSINELYSLRGAIEGLAVRLAVGRYDEARFGTIQRHVETMQRAAQADDPAGFAQADISFHNEICLISGHKRLADVWQRHEAITMTLLRLTISLDQDLSASAAKHLELLNLIKAGDPQAAETELANHLEGSRARMVRVWERALERRRSIQAQN